MMAKPLYDCHCFLRNRLAELWNLCRIVSASERKVLPDQESEFVANFIKDIVLVNTTSPNPTHNQHSLSLG